MPRRPGRPADQQHQRIAALLRVLVQQPRTAVQLKRAMGLDPGSASDDRKFRRDLRSLRNAGWQIDSIRVGDEDRYRLTVVDRRLRTTFTDDQRAQLLRAARRARLGQLYQDLDRDLEDGEATDGPAGLGVAQHAIRHRCVLEFRYSGTDRVLHPDDVFYSGRHWYVRGYEVGTEQQFKVFRLDRAEALTAGAPHGAGPQRELPPPNRDPTRWSVGEALTAVVQTPPGDLDDVVDHLGANGHRIVADTGEIVQVELDVTNREAFLVRLLEMDARARLLGPPDLRDGLRAVLSSAVGVPR